MWSRLFRRWFWRKKKKQTEKRGSGDEEKVEGRIRGKK